MAELRVATAWFPTLLWGAGSEARAGERLQW